MKEVTASIDIDRPAATVFGYVADMSNNPNWQKGQEECVWTTDTPIRVGSTYDQTAHFLGKTITSSFEVVEFEADRKIRITSTSGTMPIDVTRTVTPTDDKRCHVTANINGSPPLLMRLLGPLLTAMIRKNVTKDYERLKQILETPSGTLD